jgi:hypothetical protein
VRVAVGAAGAATASWASLNHDDFQGFFLVIISKLYHHLAENTVQLIIQGIW